MHGTQNGKDSWKAAIETARDHFDKGFKELGKAAHQAKSQGQDAWRSAQERMREAWDDVRSRGVATWDQTRERGEVWVEDSRDYISHNPLRAVAFSALAGMILSLLLMSGRSRVNHSE